MERKILNGLFAGLVYLSTMLSAHSGSAAPSSAKDHSLKFERISVERGLSQSAVDCMVQDRRGFMWFGTKDGLNRFDGYQFKVFKHDPDEVGSISDNWVEAIFEDRRGRLWIGTWEGGLDLYDPLTERFRHFTHDPANPGSLSKNNVLAIYEDRRGILWVGTSNGLNRFDSTRGEFERYLPDPQDGAALSSEWVGSIHEDHRGNFWVGTREGLHLLDRETGRFRCYLPDGENPQSGGNHIQTIGEDPDGSLWLGTNQGLYHFNIDSETFTHYQLNPADPHSLSGNQVRSVFLDRTGTLWVGTLNGGLNRYNRESGGFRQYRHNAEDPASLSVDDVFSIREDRAGGLWIGTGKGVNYADRAVSPFRHYQHDPQDSQSLSHNSVWSIYEDRAGTVWIGTLSGGLNAFDVTRETFTHYQHDPANPRSLSSNTVWAIYEDERGNLWVGTRGGGLNLMNRSNRTFRRFVNNPNDPQSIGHDWVTTIYPDRRNDGNTLWIGTWGGGLKHFDPASGTFRHYLHDPEDPHSLSINGVWTIRQDHRGELWIGTEDGLNRFDPESGSFQRFQPEPGNPLSLSHNWITVIHEDHAGELWIGTDWGLNKYVREQGHFLHFLEKNGLPNDVIYGILEDDAGNLWISTNKGLSRFNPTAQTFKNYDIRDGLQSNEFNGGAYCRTRSGEMYFGGINGFNVFDPSEVKDNDYLPPVVITAFRRYNSDDSEGMAVSEKGISAREEVVLSYNDNIITFEFAALSYRNPVKNQYAYKLEGFNEHWIQLGNRREATFTDLDPGEYVLRVKGSNNDGVWNEAGTQLRIRITPPIWRTTWAYLTYGLMLLGLLFLVRRVELNRQRKKIQLQESEKRAAMAEAQAREKTEMLQIVEEKNKLLDEKNKELVRTQEKLVVQEKLASLGQLTAGIAHEIKNPLNFVTNFAELSTGLLEELLEELQQRKEQVLDAKTFGYIEEIMDDLTSNNRKINEHGRRADNIVKGMLLHSRGGSSEREAVDINALLDEYLNLAFHGMRARDPQFNVTLEKAYDTSLPPVPVIAQDLSRVFLNIFNNGFYAAREKFVKTPSDGSAEKPLLRVQTRDAGDTVEIRIRDNGGGIPPEIREKIFNPFFTTKPTGQGNTGLGLSISHDIVTKMHQGEIRVESEEGEYTEFVITLPKKV